MTTNQIGEIENSTPSPSNSGINGVKIRFKIIESQNLKATASLDFGWAIIKGFRLSCSKFKNEKGEDELWVLPPSYRDSGGHWHPIFFMPDKLAWEEIQTKIREEYAKASDEHYRKRMGITDPLDC